MELLSVDVGESAQDAGVVLFRLKGHLDAQTVRSLEGRFEQQIRSAHVRWVVDLGALEYISSAGLGSFIGVVSDLRARGGDIFFVGLTPKIEKIFKVLGFMRIFKSYQSEKEAVLAFKGA
ncbi:MAG TPA: STAS domain-containing protein [bacterium]|nr:STAS domain-containing protein [bacterium]